MGENLQKKWITISEKLDVKIKTPYAIQLKDGLKIEADVLLENFGAKEGMLLFSSYGAFKQYAENITELGYGYSTMSEPEDGASFVIEDIIDVLKDWTWTGPEGKRPKWM